MKLLLIILLSFLSFNDVSTTKIELMNDSYFFHATIDCDTDEEILVTQFTFNGDMISRNIVKQHKSGKRGHTIQKFTWTHWVRIRVGNDNYVFEVENRFGGECKLAHQYETVSG